MGKINNRIFWLAVIALAFICVVGHRNAFAKKVDRSPTVAKVGKYTISLDELERTVAWQKDQWKNGQEEYEAKLSTLIRLINVKLILLSAYDETFDKDSAVQAYMAGEEDGRKLRVLFDIEIAGKVTVSEKEIRERYDKMSLEYHAGHILLKDSLEAVEVYNRIVNGEDFEKLAREFSKDPGSAQNGGDLGWFTIGRLVKEFEDAILGQKDGAVSKPFKTMFGWHIAKRLGSRPREQEPFESIKDNLRTTLENEKQREKAGNYIDDLLKKSKLKFNYSAVDIIVQKSLQGADDIRMPFSDDERNMKLAEWTGGTWKIADFDSVFLSIDAQKRPVFNDREDVENFVKAGIRMPLLLADCEKKKITKTKEYQEQYQEDLEKLMVSRYQNERIFGILNVEDSAIDSYYFANMDQFIVPKTIVVIEVQLDTKEEAEDIYRRVMNGEDIEKFVRTRSRRAYTKDAGGVLELTEKRFPDLFAVAENAPANTIIGPVKDRLGSYSVMKVVEVREPMVSPLEDVRETIEGLLFREMQDKAMREFGDRAEKKFGVTIFDETIRASVDFKRYLDK